MKRLEEIVKTLESGDLPLASLLEMYEEGVKLQNFCQGKLDEAERKVEILVRKSEGLLERESFSGEAQD
jgi:exodeoxyribonuclease VII small subunit